MASLLDRITSYLSRPKTLASANQNTANLRNTIANFRVAPDKPTISQAWQSSLQNNLPALMARGQSFGNERIDRLVNPVVKPAGQMAGGLISGLSLGFVNPTKNIEPTNRIERGANIAGNVLGVFNPIGAGNQILGRVGTLGTKWGSNLAVRAGAPTASKAIGALLGEAAQTGTMLTASTATGREFNPVTDLAFGLGTRGALGAVYKGLSRGVPKGYSPRVNNVHPMDVRDVEAALDVINTKGADRNARGEAWKTIQNVIEAYTPGYKNASNAKVKRVVEDLLDRHYKRIDALPDGSVGLVGSPNTKRVLQTLKTDKFALNNRQRRTLVNLQKTLGLDTRNVRSFEDMKAAAAELGTTPQRLLKDIENGRITDKEVVALGNVISTSSKRIASLSRKLKADPMNTTIQNQLRAEEQLLHQALSKRIKGGTEAGRAVASFRIIANKTMDPGYWLSKARQQIDLPEGKEIPTDVVTAINDYIKNNDRLGLATFVSRLGESSGAEKAVALWKAGLLTGLRTHEANVISNTAFSGLEAVKDLPATLFDLGASVLTGKRSKTVSGRQLTGIVTGAKKGAGEAYDYLRTGIDPQDIGKAEVHKPIRFGDSVAGRTAQRYVDTIFRGLGAADKVFYRSAFTRSLEEQLKLAKLNGASVDELSSLRTAPTESMLARADLDARYATFTKENALSDAIKGAKRSGGGTVRTGLDILAPFTRTPTNVATALLDYSPAGFVKTLVQAALKRGSVDQKMLSESFGRSVTGTGLVWAGYELAKNGLITGPSSASSSERAQQDLEGESANSIMVGGKWRSLNRVSPVGNLLILGAEAYNNDLDPVKTGFGATKAITEQTFLKGLSSGLKAVSEPDRFAPAFAENTVSGLIPTLSADIARGTDDYRRDPEGIVENIMERLPGLRERLPAKLDQFGNPIKQEGGLVGALTDPFNSRTPNPDALVQELKRVGYNLNYVGDEIAGEELTRPQQREYQRRAGAYTQALLPGVVSSASYQASDTDTQRSIVERVVNRAKDFAREELKAQGLDTITEDQPGQADASGLATNGKKTPYVFYDAENDQVKVIDLDFAVKPPELTGNSELDKKLTSKFKSEITSKINDVVTLYKQGQLTAEEAEALITSLEQSRGGSGSGGRKGATKAQIASAIGKIRTAASNAQPEQVKQGSTRVTQRSLGSLPSISSKAGSSLVNSARIGSTTDVDELIRRYASR